MGLIQSDGVVCYQFPALSDLSGFFHGVFLGRSVKGQGGGDAFNLGLGHGTADEEVWRNRGKMLGFFGSEIFGVYAHQVHGKDVGIFRHHKNQPFSDSIRSVQLSGDALVTDVAGTGLVIQVADCQPVIMMDPVTRVVANIHSGWRGSLQNIIGATVERMVSEFGSRPSDMVCGIGPSLGPCCAEFVNYKKEIPKGFWRYRRAGDLFDFWQISIDQLTGAGVRPGHIHLAGMCTKCNRHLFFSYRATQDTGRFAAVVGIRSGKGSKG